MTKRPKKERVTPTTVAICAVTLATDEWLKALDPCAHHIVVKLLGYAASTLMREHGEPEFDARCVVLAEVAQNLCKVAQLQTDVEPMYIRLCEDLIGSPPPKLRLV